MFRSGGRKFPDIGRYKFLLRLPFSNSKVCDKCGARQGPVEAARYIDATEVDADWSLSDVCHDGKNLTELKFWGVGPPQAEPSRHWLNRETRAKPALEGEPPEGFWDAMTLLVDMREKTLVMTLAERRSYHKYLMWMDPETRDLYRHYPVVDPPKKRKQPGDNAGEVPSSSSRRTHYSRMSIVVRQQSGRSRFREDVSALCTQIETLNPKP